MTDALDRVTETACEGVVAVGQTFEEFDDDWQPIAVCETKTGELALVAIDPGFYSSSAAKDLLAEVVLPQLIRERDVIAIALVSSAWYVVSDDVEDKNSLLEMMPSKHPNRREAVFISAMTATRHRFLQAEVLRHDEAPPALADWVVQTDERNPIAMSGRMIEPIRQALAHQG